MNVIQGHIHCSSIVVVYKCRVYNTFCSLSTWSDRMKDPIPRALPGGLNHLERAPLISQVKLAACSWSLLAGYSLQTVF